MREAFSRAREITDDMYDGPEGDPVIAVTSRAGERHFEPWVLEEYGPTPTLIIPLYELYHKHIEQCARFTDAGSWRSRPFPAFLLEVFLQIAKQPPFAAQSSGRSSARLWEISENLHRAELTVLERKEQEAEFIRLKDRQKDRQIDLQSSQVVTIESKRDDRRGHRPESGINAAARDLPIPGKTEEAKEDASEKFSVAERQIVAVSSIFSEPHARPVAVARDEDHAGRFEGSPQHVERRVLRCRLSTLEVADCCIADFRLFSKPLLRPV